MVVVVNMPPGVMDPAAGPKGEDAWRVDEVGVRRVGVVVPTIVVRARRRSRSRSRLVGGLWLFDTTKPIQTLKVDIVVVADYPH